MQIGIGKRLFGAGLGATALVAGLSVAAAPAGAQPSSSAPSATCSGGSIEAGTYNSLTISGFCAVDSGNVTVSHNLVVLPGAGLNAAFGGSDLSVGQNLTVGRDAILVLGCEPVAFTCFNDPTDSEMTNDSIGGNLTANGALMMLVHNNTIGSNVTQSGGGGGVTCDNFPLGPPPDNPPAYSTYEDNIIGRNAIISGVQTCWMGFIRNTVSGTVNYSGNVLADPDGNEVVTNTIAGNLNCSSNVPAPQIGDSAGDQNNVSGRTTGQCIPPLPTGV